MGRHIESRENTDKVGVIRLKTRTDNPNFQCIKVMTNLQKDAEKAVNMKTEIVRGWALRVGGPLPYLWGHAISYKKTDITPYVAEPFHRIVKVVMMPLAEYRRLKRLDK